MSRTYRRQNVAAPRYVTHKWTFDDNFSCGLYMPKTSSETKKELAKYHSDGTTSFGYRPGTKFCNFYQRKYRRDAVTVLNQYVLDVDTEVSILRKPQLPYWN